MTKKRVLKAKGEKKAKGRPRLEELAQKKKSEKQQSKKFLAHFNKDDSGSDHPKHTKPPAPSAPSALSIYEALMRSQSQPSQQSQQSHVVSAIGTGNVTATLIDAELEDGHILIRDFRSVERQHRDYENGLFNELIESERIGDTESYDWKSFEVTWNKKVVEEEGRIRRLREGAPEDEKRIRLYRKTWGMLQMHYTSAVERSQTSHTRSSHENGLQRIRDIVRNGGRSQTSHTRSSHENGLQRIRDIVRNGGHTPQTGAESSGG
jgi:hypothetical protein